MGRFRWLAIAVALCGCSTPPPPPALVIGARGDDLARLARVGGMLATANVELCAESVGVLPPAAAAQGKAALKRCKITLRLVPRPEVGAAADGTELLLSAGMLGFVADDDELAVVIAHRLGHLLAAYPKPAQPLLARVGDGLGLGAASAPEPVYDAPRERAADRISLFLLARADIDPAAAVRFWQRIAALPPGANDWLVRHPVTPARIDDMTSIVTEIALLRDAKQPLDP